MNPARSTFDNISWKFPRSLTSTVVIGDSQVKYLHQHFDPNCESTPAFITKTGAYIDDINHLLDFVPATTTALILHVGANDLCSVRGGAVFDKYRSLMERIFKERPHVSRIYATIILPRTTNRRRGNHNRPFISRCNREACIFNQRLRAFCHRTRKVFYIDHGFQHLPPTRVLAADGLHPSFEGVALIASHIQGICFRKGRYTSPGWRDFSAVEKNTVPSLNNKNFPPLSSAASQTHPPTAAQVVASNGFSSTTDHTGMLDKPSEVIHQRHKAPAAPSKSKKVPPSGPPTYNLRKNAGQGAAKNCDV
ncbi:hypothetical protein HPB49_009373 [Dermacentor silvarum]|uniref:Uncharacterized protein n=1 Tax=Dermacentor silvarum TaxID=543639 RepID=A0ACB8DYF8_DERSI|nr:hypothetical protein HPB49_009373 [Dermacentor silvarum]